VYNSGNDSKVYVGNLPWSANEDDLYDIFANYGTVTLANVVMDRETGRSRGFGFVTMGTPEEANAAVQSLDGEEIDGRNVRVNLASN